MIRTKIYFYTWLKKKSKTDLTELAKNFARLRKSFPFTKLTFHLIYAEKWFALLLKIRSMCVGFQLKSSSPIDHVAARPSQ